MKTEDETIYNDSPNSNEETQLKETPKPENADSGIVEKTKSNSWKKVTIGGASGILLGAAGALFAGSSVLGEEHTADHGGGNDAAQGAHVPTGDLPVATVNDDMSFSEAFATARNEVGPGGVFTWHGGTYGTYHSDEWEAMTPEQHAEFAGKAPHTETAAVVDAEPTDAHATEQVADAHDAATASEVTVETVAHTVENQTVESVDVQVLGVGDIMAEDGSIVTVGYAEVDGHEVYLVDLDHDGTFDQMGSDLNHDGIMSENEIHSIHDQGITVDHFEQQVAAQYPTELLSDGMDYTNDGDALASS